MQFLLKPVFILHSESACEVLKDHSYTDVVESESVQPNPRTVIECAKKCSKRREKKPNVNGMTWDVNTKECHCMIGMKGKKQLTGYDICFFGM